MIIVFSWTTNIISQVQFSSNTITTSADFARSVYAIDVDGDGDIDVLSASSDDDKIAWYENDGNENFTAHIITIDAFSANSVYAIDVDGDGDIDVLSASFWDDKIAWYENLLIVGIDDNNPLGVPFQFQLYNNYPNPFNPTTKIKYQLPELSFVTLKVYDVLGNEVAILVSEEKPIGTYELIWHSENLPSGIYFYRLQAGSFVETKKMVLLK